MWENLRTAFGRCRTAAGDWRESSSAQRFKRRGESFAVALFRYALLIGLAFIILYPLLYILSMAFREARDILDPSVTWLPRHFTMQNIIDAFEAMRYPQALWNTISISVVSSLLQLCSCAIVGYGFARFQFKGKSLLFGLVLLTIIIPPQIIFIPTYLMYSHYDFFGLTTALFGEQAYANLIDTNWTMYLPAALGVGIRSGLFIFIFRQFFRGLPKELEDAAYVDGCGHARTFLRVIVPNAGGAFLTVFLFSLVWYWNDYYYVSMYFNKTQNISIALQGLTRNLSDLLMQNTNETSVRAQAGCLLTILPLLIVFIFLQKYFTEGLERTWDRRIG